jgi:hypothetical protein
VSADANPNPDTDVSAGANPNPDTDVSAGANSDTDIDVSADASAIAIPIAIVIPCQSMLDFLGFHEEYIFGLILDYLVHSNTMLTILLIIKIVLVFLYIMKS